MCNLEAEITGMVKKRLCLSVKEFAMNPLEKKIKLAGTALGILFAVITVGRLLSEGQSDRLLLAIATIFLIMLPAAMERLFHCRICLPVYIFGLLYAIGPMLGHCWYLYYTVSWWDKLLHICGGVMFTIVGAFFFDRLVQGKQTPIAGALFALCFSIAIAAIWEFAEFGADRFLGMDMQDDTVITGIRSYLLGETIGVTGSIENIQSVSVNGTALPVNGYIDIGLIDSMLDMLLESMGALVTSALLWLDKGKHTLIKLQRNKNTER